MQCLQLAWRLKKASQRPVADPWQYQNMSSCTRPLTTKHAIMASARSCVEI